ncbi:DNA polymerase III subunit delta [Paenalkalicoccus suaedae]|uniref:DNA polymerase III subunit delta n=1 Tax=Paenalkalicoccus suaedae TaxID=2592382 RepID=A0A859FDE4_9BACI|nr:DNA polymerase III subunit delta [Paenalkalicoccus suaedae]QKS70841.1 DNA polymerase III subunit delta [Paenalkalicoccus suaedae]
MSYLKVSSDIQKGNIAPIYLLYGTETYLIEDIIQKVINSVLHVDEHDMKLVRYDMTETSIDEAIEEAYTFPFMGGMKVVIAQDAGFLTGAKQKLSFEHTIQKLVEYVDHAPEETVFILTTGAEKLDERKKVVKSLKKSATVLHAAPLEQKELMQWIAEKAKELGVTIEREAASYLIEVVGDHLLLLSSELSKLALYNGDETTITKKEVELLVPRSFEQDIFALVDAVVKRNATRSMRIYRDLLKQKEAPLKILSLMVRQFRILYQVKQLVKQGYGEKMIAGRIKQHPYAVKLASKQVASFQTSELANLIKELAELDFSIKTGKVSDELGVELFLLKRS